MAFNTHTLIYIYIYIYIYHILIIFYIIKFGVLEIMNAPSDYLLPMTNFYTLIIIELIYLLNNLMIV